MKKTTRRRTATKKTTYEYKIVNFPLEDDVLLRAQVDPEARNVVNLTIQEEINKHGKEGWRLHSIGSNSFIIERES